MPMLLKSRSSSQSSGVSCLLDWNPKWLRIWVLELYSKWIIFQGLKSDHWQQLEIQRISNLTSELGLLIQSQGMRPYCKHFQHTDYLGCWSDWNLSYLPRLQIVFVSIVDRKDFYFKFSKWEVIYISYKKSMWRFSFTYNDHIKHVNCVTYQT